MTEAKDIVQKINKIVGCKHQDVIAYSINLKVPTGDLGLEEERKTIILQFEMPTKNADLQSNLTVTLGIYGEEVINTPVVYKEQATKKAQVKTAIDTYLVDRKGECILTTKDFKKFLVSDAFYIHQNNLVYSLDPSYLIIQSLDNSKSLSVNGGYDTSIISGLLTRIKAKAKDNIKVYLNPDDNCLTVESTLGFFALQPTISLSNTKATTIDAIKDVLEGSDSKTLDKVELTLEQQKTLKGFKQEGTVMSVPNIETFKLLKLDYESSKKDDNLFNGIQAFITYPIELCQ